jgi:hypothetical protein
MPRTCQACHQDIDLFCEIETGQDKLCYECFEASLEEYEEKRRERIAISNEY